MVTLGASPAVPPPALPWRWCVVMLVDLFESVRLNHELGQAQAERWVAFVNAVRCSVLPANEGRWIKSTGDGMLLEFEHPQAAAAAALELHQLVVGHNDGFERQHAMLLRIGIHAGEMAVAEFDNIGSVVDLAQRLMTLAQPGETVVSDVVRGVLVEDVDGDLHDLGDCWVKHWPEPVRGYRLGPAADRSGLATVSQRRDASMRATIAVMPFECRLGYDPGNALGMALSEEVIVHLSKAAQMDVISGQSMRQLTGRSLLASQVSQRLDAHLVMSGGYRVAADRVVLNLQLVDTRRGTVVMAEQFETTAHAAFDPADPLAYRVVDLTIRALFQHANKVTVAEPLLAVEGYALLFSAVGRMHRATERDFERAREMLLHLVAREGRNGVAEAWLAKWHVLRVVQGWAPDAAAEQREALDHVNRSLDLNPSNALALSIGGLVHAYLRKDLATAGQMYQSALDDNPCEPLAWLFSATRHAYQGEGTMAEEAGTMALRLSPIDPLRYFFESLVATATAGNGNWPRAVELARRSLKSNRTHASTWRTLVYALMMNGQGDEGRGAAAELLRIEPGLTVGRFRERFPGRDGPMLDPWARALIAAGVPE